MRIIRYRDHEGRIGFAALQDDGSAMRIQGDIYKQYTVTETPAMVAKTLAPVVPSAILCIGLNYRRHAEEGGLAPPEHPVLFMKSLNALQNPDDPILLPRFLRSHEVDYEGELAVVIGRACKNVRREQASEYILGYTCANDVSARDWQLRLGGGQWCRGKTFDTFAPLGPCLVTPDEITSKDLRLRTTVSNRVMQDCSTRDMIFDVPSLIAFLSGSTTLLPGTVILTGTPHGVGSAQTPPRWLIPGDTVTVEIEGIGALTNPVEEEKPGIEPPAREAGR